MKNKIINRIESEKIVAIIRVANESEVEALVEKVIGAGINVLEITSNTPGFSQQIKRAKIKFPHILIGAGTITNGRLAKQAINCGAEFLVTPNTNAGIIPLAHEAKIPVMMGAMTPSEIATALEYGADFIKIFPATTLGPEYLKAIRGPFNDAKFFAVGGVNVLNASLWIKAGACGIGIGGSLTSGDPEILRSTVAELIKQVNNK